ncbi:hypothetical protein GGI35DRAFT_480467 [Trichoderma velutinum]
MRLRMVEPAVSPAAVADSPAASVQLQQPMALKAARPAARPAFASAAQTTGDKAQTVVDLNLSSHTMLVPYSRGLYSVSTPRKATPQRSGEQSVESDMDPGSCHMASRFYEIMKESGLQRQLENGWGHPPLDDTAAGSAPAPGAELGQGSDFIRPQSRQSHKTLSPSGSRKHREGGSHKSRKSKKSRSGQVKEEHDEDEEEDGMETIPPVQGSSKPYSPSHDSQATESSEERGASGYKLNGQGYGSREYMSELDSELDTLRKHLLQRATAPRTYP